MPKQVKMVPREARARFGVIWWAWPESARAAFGRPGAEDCACNLLDESFGLNHNIYDIHVYIHKFV